MNGYFDHTCVLPNDDERWGEHDYEKRKKKMQIVRLVVLHKIWNCLKRVCYLWCGIRDIKSI